MAALVFRPLFEARLEYQQQQQQERNPKDPALVLLESQCKLYVEGTAVEPEGHSFVQALGNSGRLEKGIDVKEISMTEDGSKKVLGWCAFTYQVNTKPLVLICSSCHAVHRIRPAWNQAHAN